VDENQSKLGRGGKSFHRISPVEFPKRILPRERPERRTGEGIRARLAAVRRRRRSWLGAKRKRKITGQMIRAARLQGRKKPPARLCFYGLEGAMKNRVEVRA